MTNNNNNNNDKRQSGTMICKPTFDNHQCQYFDYPAVDKPSFTFEYLKEKLIVFFFKYISVV